MKKEFPQITLLPPAYLLDTPVLEQRKIPEDFKKGIFNYYGEDNLVALIGYGSYWNNQATATSIPDVLGVVKNLEKFHLQNRRKHPQLYGPGPTPLHLWYDQFGPGYYRPKMQLEGRSVQIKAPVISEQSFHSLGRGGIEDGLAMRPFTPFDFHFEGKLAKFGLLPIHPSTLSPEIAETINQARINYFALNLLRLPERVQMDQAVLMMNELSYRIDPRVEPKGKIKQLVKSNPDGNKALINTLIEAFREVGFVEKIDDQSFWNLASKDAQSTSSLRRLLVNTFLVGIPINYGKNFLSGNPVDSLIYGVMKLLRAVGVDEKIKQIYLKSLADLNGAAVWPKRYLLPN